MWKQAFVQKIVAMIDVSRPVTILLVGEGMGDVAKEVLRAISPTSRMLVWHAPGVQMGDERIEVLLGDDALSEVFRARHVTRCDAVICAGKGSEDANVQEAVGKVSPGGDVVMFPVSIRESKDLEHLLNNSATHLWWNGIVPVRVFSGKR